MLCYNSPPSIAASTPLLVLPAQRWRRPSAGLVCGPVSQQPTVALTGRSVLLPVPAQATASEEEEEADVASQIVRCLCSGADWRRVEEVLDTRFDALLTTQVVEEVVKKLAALEQEGIAAFAFFHWAGKRHGYVHNTSSYNLMLSLLGSKLKLVLKLLNQMQTQQCPLDKQTLQLLGTMLGSEARDVLEAGVDAFLRLEATGFRFNSFAHDCVLDALVEDQRLEMACTVCKHMLKSGAAAVEVGTATALVRQLCRLGRVELLSDLLRDLEHRGLLLSEVTYTECMQAFGKAGDVETALSLFQQMRTGSLSCKPDKVAFSAAMRWLCEAQRMDEAKRLMDEMHASSCSPDVVSYNTLIAGYCKAGDAEAALQLFHSMASGHLEARPNVVTYDTLVVHLCRMCRAELAFETFNRMVEAGFRPDVNVYNALIHCSCKVGLLREAGELVWQMRTQGIAGEAFTYGILVNSHAKAGYVEQALEFLELSQQDGFSPSTINVNLVIQGLVKSGKLGRAIELFQKRLSQPDVFTYNLLISGHGKSGNVDAAWQLLSEMQATGCRPDMCTFNTVLHSLRRAHRMHEYRTLLAEMRRQGFGPTQQMAGVIITTLATAPGYTSEAIQYLNEAIGNGCIPEVSSYNVLVGELCKAHNFEEACNVFLSMASFSPATCNLLLRKLIVADRRKHIDRLLLETHARGIELRSYLIALLYKLGRLDDALEHFAVLRSEGLPISPPTYGYAISSLCKSNRLSDAMTVFEEIQLAGMELDVYTYSVLMDALSKAGQPDEAVHIFHHMNKSGCCQPDVVVYNVLISCLGKHGRIDEALAVFEQMRVTPEARTYNILIDVLSTCGRFDRACAFFGTMRRMMKQQQQQAADVVTFNTVLKGLKRLGRHDEAYQLFQEMQGQCCPDLVTFGTVIDSLAKAGRMQEAEKLVSMLQKTGYACNSCIYNSLIKGYCRSGDLPRGYQLFQDMPVALVDMVTYKILVLGFSKSGQADMAVHLFQEMTRKGHAASVVTYNVLIRCLSAAGRDREAYTLFREMIRKGFTPDAVTYSVLPNTVVCHQRVETFCCGDSDDG